MTPNTRLRVRRIISDRHKGRCAYCQVFVGLKAGSLDHYMPKALGGTNAQSNLRWACRACNQLKGDMHPDEWVPRVPLLPQRAKPTRAEVRAALLSRIAPRCQDRDFWRQQDGLGA